MIGSFHRWGSLKCSGKQGPDELSGKQGSMLS